MGRPILQDNEKGVSVLIGMRRARIPAAVAACAAAMAVVLAGCSSTSGATGGTSGVSGGSTANQVSGTSGGPGGSSSGATSGAAGSRPFTVNWGTSVTSLDPAFICPWDDNSFASNFYGRLLRLSEDEVSPGVYQYNSDPSKVQPELAESWKVSDDGLTYTFVLRKDMTFANGDPLDAAAVKYSLDRTLGMGACGALGLNVGAPDPGLVKSVAAPDATTVVVSLYRPEPAFIYGLAQSRASIYDPKEVQAHGGYAKGQANEWMASHTASSSGPYVLTEYVPNDHAILTANPKYPATAALEPVVRVNFITSVPTLLLQAQNGQADVTLGLPPQSVHSLSTDACCRVVAADSPSPVTVSMNYGGPVTDNLKLREALTYAVPYQEILSKVAYGYGDIYYGPMVPGMTGFDAAKEPARTYDVAKAKALVAESGLANPAITLMINPTTPGVTNLATLLQSAWGEIGVTVTLDSKTPAEFSTLFNTGKYQTALLYENSTPIGPLELRKKMTCGSSFNNQHICIPGTQELLQQLDGAVTVEEQQPIVDKLVEAWRANSPTMILYRAKWLAVLNKDVKHFDYLPTFRFAEWGR
jgi:peptide/nickel transport system substrate-binding protein